MIASEPAFAGSTSPTKELLLASLRCEYLRTRAWLADLQALGIALKGGLISPDQAAEHMRDLDLLSPLAVQIEESAR